jgi:branched-chain amino acid transport system ATP-binding protein
MPDLLVNDIHAHLGGAYIIQGVTLQVQAGRTVVILGQNGAGKTTLVRALMGLTGPLSGGGIVWNDQDIARLPAWSRVDLGFGYVPQSRRIFPSLTVEENLRVASRADNGKVRRWTLAEVFALFPNLQERRHLRSGLSGGEQQMLAIGRALMGCPQLIILDEPTEGLSPAMVARVREVLLELKQGGYSILLIEQNFRFAAAVADDVYFMQSGRMVFHGQAMSEAQIAEVAEAKLGMSHRIINEHGESQTV